MPSTYSNLKIQLMATGENNTTWGNVTNTNLGTALEEAIVGSADVAFSNASVTLTLADTNASQTARNVRLNLTGTATAGYNLIVPAINKPYIVNNATDGTITVKNATGTGIAVPSGATTWLFNNGTNVVSCVTYLTSLTLGSALTVPQGGTGASTLTGYVKGSGTSALTASATIPASDIGSGAALTRVDDTNVTLTLGGTPTTALLAATSLTLGWTGQLSVARGGTALSSTPTNGQLLIGNGTGYTLATLTAGSGITVTNGSGTITIAATSTGLTNWTEGVNTSAPNATVPVVYLTATNAATNVDAAILTKGSGAFALAVADSTATGGNKRGTYAVDLQLSRVAATNVASGNSSFAAGVNNTASGQSSLVAGGANNTASGLYAAALGGASNNASNTYGIAGGYSSLASGSNSICLGNNSTAASADSIAIGGSNNTASNSYAAVMGGFTNTASGYTSIVLGGAYGTTRGGYGLAHGGNPIANTAGASQFRKTILGRQTTDTTATVLAANTSAAGASNQVRLDNNSAFYFKGTVIANVTGGGNTKGWTIEGVIKRGANAASTALVGTATVTSSYADAGASTWSVSVTADTTNGCLAITVTGQASTTIRWVASVETTEVTF